MANYTNYTKSMDIEGAETGPEPIITNPPPSSHRIINRKEVNGVVYFRVQWAQPFMKPCWVIQTNEPWLQTLIMEYEGPSKVCPMGSMDIQQSECLKQESNVYPQLKSPQKMGRRRLKAEEYERLTDGEVKVIVEKFIGKIKKVIFKLKALPNKNIYTAVAKVVSLFNGDGELGLIVQYNGTNFYKFVPYEEMQESHPRELQAFLEKCLQEYNSRCLGMFSKNFRMHADFLGKLFDNNWRKDSLGLMIREPTEMEQIPGKKLTSFDSEASANIFSVEFEMESFGNEARMMMDEQQERAKMDYGWEA